MGQRFRLKANFDMTSIRRHAGDSHRAQEVRRIPGGQRLFVVPPGRPIRAGTIRRCTRCGQVIGSISGGRRCIEPDGGSQFGWRFRHPGVEQCATGNPAAIVGGASSSLNQVVLTAPVPAGGITVALSSSNFGVASPPASVLVPAGAASATFSISTNGVAAATAVTISASYFGVTKSATLTVNPVGIASLSVGVANFRQRRSERDRFRHAEWSSPGRRDRRQYCEFRHAYRDGPVYGDRPRGILDGLVRDLDAHRLGAEGRNVYCRLRRRQPQRGSDGESGRSLFAAGAPTGTRGDTVVVTWTASQGHASNDLVTLSSSSGGRYWSQATGTATSGSFSVVLPNTTGQYVFRYLIGDVWTITAHTKISVR